MKQKKIVILGTGGTIAGQASSASDNIGYTAAQLGVAQLVRAIPALADADDLVTEQVAQIDSKDMTFAVWAYLAQRISFYLAQEDVQGVVVTHGTDTLEETAFFLQAVLSPLKPVVLTCAMRPATSLAPDGPQNVVDALAVARCAAAHGVLVVCAGIIHGALDVQKSHTYKLDAFSSGDAGPIGYVEEGALRQVRDWPATQVMRSQPAIEIIAAVALEKSWPRVEIVMNHAGAGATVVEAVVAAGVDGLVLAGTGNGTAHHALEAALHAAQTRGVQVVRASRCANGRVLAKAGDSLNDSHGLSPVKARIALMLRLIAPDLT